MKNYVFVQFLDNKGVNVDRDVLLLSNVTIDIIKNDLPDNLKAIADDIYCVTWDMSNPSRSYWDTNSNGIFDYEMTEENYNKWIKPYVDIWQAEKDRQEQEQQAAREEYAKFENRKERALNTIDADYEAVLSRGFVRTYLGFDADIKPDSTATLLGTQTGLVYAARTLEVGSEAPRTVFRDFYGLKRELDAVQVERLICEINGAQNYIRELKYNFKDQIKGTYDNDSLNAVIKDLAYSTLDYSNLDEQGNPAVLPFVESPKTILERID